MDSEKPFLPMHRVATRLGLPIAWLRAEAEAGRVPFLKVGRQILMNFDMVQEAMLKRSRAGERTESEAANV